jgi:hypothetical protein
MNPRVSSEIPSSDCLLWITFDNGEKRVFNMKDNLNLGNFYKLKDLIPFKTARISMGTVCWDNGLDLYPDTLYLYSIPI